MKLKGEKKQNKNYVFKFESIYFSIVKAYESIIV